MDWFEIISKNYMVDGGRPLKILDQILDQYGDPTWCLLNAGGTQPTESGPPRHIKELTKRTKTPGSRIIFAGAAWTGAIPTTFCLCRIRSRAVRTAAERIQMMQDYLEIPVAISAISGYAAYNDSQMTEWEFADEIGPCCRLRHPARCE